MMELGCVWTHRDLVALQYIEQDLRNSGFALQAFAGAN